MTAGGGFEGWMYFGDGGWRMEDGEWRMEEGCRYGVLRSLVRR